MKSILTKSLTALVGVAALALQACGDEATQDSATTSDSSSTGSPLEAVFVEEAPEGAVSVIDARSKAVPGTELVINGRIAGAMSPFSENFATFVLADDSLMTCEKNAEDKCKTPWDACCVPQEKIAASRLTVQVLGEDGRPVSQSMKGVRDLTELDGLVVTGTVAEGSNEDNLIVNATKIYAKE